MMPSETKVKCKSCGHVYHYNFSDTCNNFSKKCDNAARILGALGGNLFFAARKSETTIDYNKCQKCGSRNVVKKTVKF